MKKNKNDRKIFILDTSVLLYDKYSISSFPNNDVLIPLVVLDELDSFKDKKGLLGENARYINRYLDDLRKSGNLHAGIEIENEQTLKVALSGFKNVPVGLDPDLPDNQMISLALKMTQESAQKVIMVTKDINFRVKCDALGIRAEDYEKDKIVLEEDDLYKGYLDINVSDSNIIDNLYKNGSTEDKGVLSVLEDHVGRKFYENEFLCIKKEQQSFLGKYSKGKIEKVVQVDDMDLGIVSVRDRNREQLYALNLLRDQSFSDY